MSRTLWYGNAAGSARRAAVASAGNGSVDAQTPTRVVAPPVAAREPTRVLLGRVEGENRGADPSVREGGEKARVTQPGASI